MKEHLGMETNIIGSSSLKDETDSSWDYETEVCGRSSISTDTLGNSVITLERPSASSSDSSNGRENAQASPYGIRDHASV